MYRSLPLGALRGGNQPLLVSQRADRAHAREGRPAYSSMRVMQLEDSTFWAGSWPVAMNMAVTILEACALLPPMDPAMAEPIKFFWTLRSTSDSTVVWQCRKWVSCSVGKERAEKAERDGNLEHVLDYSLLDGGLSDHGLAASLEPVDGRRLLVSAIVARQRQNLEVGEVVFVRHTLASTDCSEPTQTKP